MIYGLPHSLEVGGKEYNIRTDFRDVMRVILAMKDPNLENKEKVFVCLYVIYEDFYDIPDDQYEEAFEKASWFLNCGDEAKEKKRERKSIIDFEQDEHLIMAAVNRVAGCEVRELEHLHWWTFMGYFMEIGECTYSTILNLRSKKNKGKAFEKWEKEFWDNNKEECVIHEKLTDRQQEDLDIIRNAFK